MRKRLRKKLRIKEFIDYGFFGDIKLKDLSYETHMDITYRILDFCYDNKMCYGGSMGNFFITGYVSIWSKKAAIKGKEILKNWLLKQKEVKKFYFGEIEDANNPEDNWDNWKKLKEK